MHICSRIAFNPGHFEELSAIEKFAFPGLFEPLFEGTKEICSILHTYLALTADMDLAMTVLDIVCLHLLLRD